MTRKKMYRRKGEKDFQGSSDESQEEIVVLKWTESLRSSVPLLFVLFRLLFNVRAHLDTLAGQKKYDIKSFIFAYIALSLPSYLGLAGYGVIWGYKYFNVWYLVFIPTFGLLFGVFIIFLFQYALFFFFGKGRFSYRKSIYVKYLFLFFVLSPLAWLFYPLKIFWPSWEHHVFYISLVISFLFFIRSVQYKPNYFRRIDLIFGFLFSCVPYYAALYFLPEISAWFVRLAKL